MATIVTRAGKGSQLTHTELDANFTNLNTDKIELTNISVTDSGGDGSLAYNNSTGVITYTGPSAAEARAHISVTDSGGDGSLAYNSSTGVITYTGPSASEVRAHVSVNTVSASSGGALAYDNSTGVFTFTPAVPTATTINNNADNRIITGSGSANTLEGESTLLYNGTSLSNTTAPTFTEASVPVQFNGTQPNAGGYNVYKSINTGTTRGGQGYRSQPAAGGSAKVDTHTLFFDLDDDYGLRPTGSFQGDRNFYLQANHTADMLSIYFDGFSTNTIESFDGNNGSYARTPIELHGSTTTLKAAGTSMLACTSSTLTVGGVLDTNGNNITLGGGNVDLEGGGIINTSGDVAFDDNVQVNITSAGTDTLTVNNASATGLGFRVNLGNDSSANHTSGDAILTRRGTGSAFVETFKVSTVNSGAKSEVLMEQLGHLTNQAVVGTGSKSDQGYIEVQINGATRYIPYYS